MDFWPRRGIYSTRVAAKSGELITIGLATRLITERAQKRQLATVTSQQCQYSGIRLGRTR